uniref:Uncharacterized protein n=1 Tax=Chromera velia CCMP2878 TaxID=1169474 RepID=A0A0G4FPA2_9ALVE|eukprot:Cvel_17961.t1-p1 / transcript=Cvel_17961.t1 / gene=Cvel_17961 / organism=Chromera_velia_CCMP2878 / gene_product=hypothetical protein / transcript_product=hypothetical protein / location=Cvel_scaffold1461:35030-35320(-) / protein_length=97 / sequence_SO=supercontig / SO=protein_coding / is_pseudo=false
MNETTPMGAALVAGFREGVEALAEVGTNLNAPTRTGKSFTKRDQQTVPEPTPSLLFALTLYQWDIVEVLFRAGVDAACIRKKEVKRSRPVFIEEYPS